ncbi:uncharacterized protein LOC124142343 [Haliotis rufescens]|uniref:uncharacterized protein LOC124142343 n=1 Tax=Haliotis rufescens TaxID=6454 RepID=UPI00201F605B|nr:uncharacterized protein LOC124142343 [Haliotis rufescens]
MGKLTEGKSPIKRETVSASANLEVVSEEKFAKRLEGLSSSCINCQKERTKGQRRHPQKGKRKQVKTNTPIVIHLKDTLKAALQQRQRSLEEDSEASVRSGDSDLPHDQDDIVTCVPKYSLRELHRDRPHNYKKHHHHNKSKKKDNKNLNALISVIEKAHHKDSRNLECNFAKDNPLLNSKLSDMLNNATRSNEMDGAKRRSIVECENVELICNDLYNTEKHLESLEDTESDKSSVASSSENYSVSDSDSIQVDDTVPFEFTPEELEKLANYTTGFPLIRYDCPPSECPECLSAWYSYQYYTIQDYSILPEKKSSSVPERGPREGGAEAEVVTVDVEAAGATAAVDSDKTLTEIDCDLGTDEEIEIEAEHVTTSQYQKAHRQLWDIDISSQRRHKPDHSFPDSVYIDLTGTDVSLSVYYHHNQSSQDANYANSHSSSSNGTTWYPPPQHMPGYYWSSSCYQMPLYSHHHLSSPYLHSNNSLPKTAMVPPRELKKFHASAPPPRQWIPIGHPDKNKPAAIFTVMCYNVLCDKYCTRQQYGYCPSWALNWEYRKKGIMEEIRGCNADIISLQEVETDQFYSMFLPELKQDGYDGIFSPKSRARTMTEQERKHVDGCAIFFRTSKFSLVKEQLIEFNQLAMANAEGHDDMLNRVMTKDNIGLAALLETKKDVFDHSGPYPPEHQVKQPILVATAHIHWDPEFSDVKLIQTMMLMSELRQVIEEAQHQFRPGSSSSSIDCNNIPLILCGDLNSLPDSGVVEYLTSGKVAANHEDFKEIGYDSCLQKINTTIEKESFSHNFRLSRAYMDVMPYTNYTYDFKGIIDYIFYSKDHMNMLGMLGPLDEEWFRQNKVIGCPHPHIPSDHFSLFVEYEMPVGTTQNGRSNNTNSNNANNSSSSSSAPSTGKQR